MNRPALSRPRHSPPLPRKREEGGDLSPRPSPVVDYPDSDGQPVAETDFQRGPLWYANDVLARHFRHREDVYVSANMFVYYEEGKPGSVVAPDVFVVLGTPKYDRRSYKIWEEPKGPDFVLEVTSQSTRRVDQGPKRRVYATLGVEEYWQFDPTGDYLAPPLQGGRLVGGGYVRLPLRPAPDGARFGRSEVLGLELGLVEGRLRLRNPATGRDLLSSEELEELVEQEAEARRAAESRVEQETRARQAAEARAAELDARLQGTHRPPPPDPADTH